MVPQYGYKAGYLSIITLQILGKTNEGRNDVFDSNYAKFRCSSAIVVDIEHYDTQEKMNMDVSTYDSSFIYEVGKEVVPHKYGEDLNKICAPGIHYFKTKEAAESYFCQHLDGEEKNGIYRTWHDNGRLWTETTIKDGELDGLYKSWFSDGNIAEESIYKNGLYDGPYKAWSGNGQLIIECTYKNGILDGTYKYMGSDGCLIENNINENGIKTCGRH